MVKLMLNILIVSVLLCLASALSSKEMAERMRICLMKSSYGYCRGQQTRWFYDTVTNDCKSFMYSGCGGNPNRFPSLPQCLDYCTHQDLPYDFK